MSDDAKKTAGALRALASMHHERCPANRGLNELANDVETQATMQGPAQVATAQYRVNYESIFGAKQEVGQA